MRCLTHHPLERAAQPFRDRDGTACMTRIDGRKRSGKEGRKEG